MDNFTTRTIAMWISHDAAAQDAIMNKGNAAASSTSGWFFRVSATNVLEMEQGFSTTPGSWNAGTISATSGRNHIAITYDRSATTNNPVIYVDGASQSVTTVVTPVGTSATDDTNNVKTGESLAGTQDLDARLGNICYVNAIWDASQVNRAMWWGRPGGGLEVYHPFYTDKLNNEGSATANGTATGTTVASLPCPAVRPGSSLMGMGVGW